MFKLSLLLFLSFSFPAFWPHMRNHWDLPKITINICWIFYFRYRSYKSMLIHGGVFGLLYTWKIILCNTGTSSSWNRFSSHCWYSVAACSFSWVKLSKSSLHLSDIRDSPTVDHQGVQVRHYWQSKQMAHSFPRAQRKLVITDLLHFLVVPRSEQLYLFVDFGHHKVRICSYTTCLNLNNAGC